MMKRIYRVVLKSYDEADAMASIRHDWHEDAKGADHLNRQGFCDALFQLADLCKQS